VWTPSEEDEFDEVVIAGAPPNASTAAWFSPDDEVLTKLENRG
jgi:hypothetical protein